MKKSSIDRLQLNAYSNACRRGFYGGGYTLLDAITHLKKEVGELEAAIISGDRVNREEEGGDVILLTLTLLHKLGITGSDAVNRAFTKELLKEDGFHKD